MQTFELYSRVFISITSVYIFSCNVAVPVASAPSAIMLRLTTKKYSTFSKQATSPKYGKLLYKYSPHFPEEVISYATPVTDVTKNLKKLKTFSKMYVPAKMTILHTTQKAITFHYNPKWMNLTESSKEAALLTPSRNAALFKDKLGEKGQKLKVSSEHIIRELAKKKILATLPKKILQAPSKQMTNEMAIKTKNKPITAKNKTLSGLQSKQSKLSMSVTTHRMRERNTSLTKTKKGFGPHGRTIFPNKPHKDTMPTPQKITSIPHKTASLGSTPPKRKRLPFRSALSRTHDKTGLLLSIPYKKKTWGFKSHKSYKKTNNAASLVTTPSQKLIINKPYGRTLPTRLKQKMPQLASKWGIHIVKPTENRPEADIQREKKPLDENIIENSTPFDKIPHQRSTLSTLYKKTTLPVMQLNIGELLYKPLKRKMFDGPYRGLQTHYKKTNNSLLLQKQNQAYTHLTPQYERLPENTIIHAKIFHKGNKDKKNNVTSTAAPDSGRPTYIASATPAIRKLMKPVDTESATLVGTESATPAYTESAKPIRTKSATLAYTESTKSIYTKSATQAYTKSAEPIDTQSTTLAYTESAKPIDTESVPLAYTESVKPVHLKSTTEAHTKSVKPVHIDSTTLPYTESMRTIDKELVEVINMPPEIVGGNQTGKSGNTTLDPIIIREKYGEELWHLDPSSTKYEKLAVYNNCKYIHKILDLAPFQYVFGGAVKRIKHMYDKILPCNVNYAKELKKMVDTKVRIIIAKQLLMKKTTTTPKPTTTVKVIRFELSWLAAINGTTTTTPSSK